MNRVMTGKLIWQEVSDCLVVYYLFDCTFTKGMFC